VYEVNPQTGAVTSIMSKLWAADGAWIDQTRSLLYVSEVLSGTVIIYDLIGRKEVANYNAPLRMLDDFTLSPDGTILYGADFWNNTIVEFASNGKGPGRILLSGVRRNQLQQASLTSFLQLKSPTSARFGNGYGFKNTSLYVTEGGGIFASTTDRRVLEIPNVLR